MTLKSDWVDENTPGKTAPDWTFTAAAANSVASTVNAALAGIVNVRDYGAVGDGATDDSDAFLAAFTAAATTRQADLGMGVERGHRAIYIPAGTYKIVDAGAFMCDLTVAGLAGIKWYGDGREVSAVVFSPGVADQYLCSNPNDFLHLTFEDLSFYSTVATASFMVSDSDSTAQNYVFNRCNWGGTWKYGLHLTGSNNNAEMVWYHCGIAGDWTAYLYADASDSSDQMVDYNFQDTQIEVATGDFISMAKGGDINVWGGSLIHQGDDTQAASSPQCFFKLGAGETTHAGGCQRLLVVGVRVEHRHENSTLIECDWTRGNVTFLSCDTETWNYELDHPENVVQAEFNGNRLPVIVFDGCTLMGTHEYHYDGSSFNARPSVSYRSCEMVTFDTAAEFVTFTNDDSTTNIAGIPAVGFQNCRALGTDPREQYDCLLNWQQTENIVTQTRTLSIKMPWSGLPSTSTDPAYANLPLNAVITRVRSGKGASGSSGETAFHYTLTDADNVTIADAVGTGGAWSDGYTYDSGALWYPCSTENKRTLTVTATGISQTIAGNYFLIDYLA